MQTAILGPHGNVSAAVTRGRSKQILPLALCVPVATFIPSAYVVPVAVLVVSRPVREMDSQTFAATATPDRLWLALYVGVSDLACVSRPIPQSVEAAVTGRRGHAPDAAAGGRQQHAGPWGLSATAAIATFV